MVKSLSTSRLGSGRYTGRMSNLPATIKGFAIRYKWLLIAFVAGFLVFGGLSGVLMASDAVSKPYGTELGMALDIAESALRSGLMGGVAALILSAVVRLLALGLKKLFK